MSKRSKRFAARKKRVNLAEQAIVRKTTAAVGRQIQSNPVTAAQITLDRREPGWADRWNTVAYLEHRMGEVRKQLVGCGPHNMGLTQTLIGLLDDLQKQRDALVAGQASIPSYPSCSYHPAFEPLSPRAGSYEAWARK